MFPNSIRVPKVLAAFVAALTLAGAATSQQGTQVTCKLEFDVVPSEGTTKVQVTALVPQSILGRQSVSKIEFAPEPTRRFEANGASYVEFVVAAPAQLVSLSVTATLQLLPPKANPLRERPEGKGAFQPWLAAEKFLEVEDPSLQDAAKSMKGGSEEDVARAIAKFVVGHLAYSGFAMEPKGAAAAMKSKTGDCTEYSDLMIALCRARGIPARHCSGYVTEWETVPCHSWVEVYLKAKGWVLFDPSQARFGINLLNGPQPTYLHLSSVRNDERLGGHQLFHYAWEGAPAKVTSGFTITGKGKAKTWRQ